jgi:ABC-type multidrug transport system ATPase subunit
MDIVSIGRSSFVLRGGQLLKRASERDISLTATGLFRPDGKRGTRLPLDVCFSVPGNCLLAISGPAGAGKTTLLSALAGNCPPTEGMVLYGDRNLYEDHEELKGLIGFVPQQSLLVMLGGIRPRGLTRLTAPRVHRFARLTARDALAYVTEARFPAAAKREQGQLVHEVLDQVSMAQHAGTLLEGLSPEQEKRLAIGLELVTRPTLLLLDEPTRQLDAHGKRELFQLMREVANTGPAVVLATGDVEPELLGLCDLMLLLAPGGKLAYLGPPGEAPSYFGRPALAEVFADLNEKPEFDWDVRYKRSPHYQKYVTETKWRAGTARTH